MATGSLFMLPLPSLVRTAGVPTALMPFYGATPRDALDALVSWLSHAHGVAA